MPEIFVAVANKDNDTLAGLQVLPIVGVPTTPTTLTKQEKFKF